VEHQAPDGSACITVFERGHARPVLHEIDHLNGVLYRDRMRPGVEPIPVSEYRGTGVARGPPGVTEHRLAGSPHRGGPGRTTLWLRRTAGRRGGASVHDHGQPGVALALGATRCALGAVVPEAADAEHDQGRFPFVQVGGVKLSRSSIPGVRGVELLRPASRLRVGCS
jgi:hypothetical protein